MSLACAIGSAKAFSALSSATGSSGESVSPARPSAWSSRRISPSPKRAASGARGRGAMQPTVLNPTRPSPVTTSSDSRSAASGRRISGATSPGSARASGAPKRASAQAAPMLSASPSRAVNPWPRSRAAISAISAASPPARWAQPVMSSISPSSLAPTSGV